MAGGARLAVARRPLGTALLREDQHHGHQRGRRADPGHLSPASPGRARPARLRRRVAGHEVQRRADVTGGGRSPGGGTHAALGAGGRRCRRDGLQPDAGQRQPHRHGHGWDELRRVPHRGRHVPSDPRGLGGPLPAHAAHARHPHRGCGRWQHRPRRRGRAAGGGPRQRRISPWTGLLPAGRRLRHGDRRRRGARLHLSRLLPRRAHGPRRRTGPPSRARPGRRRSRDVGPRSGRRRLRRHQRQDGGRHPRGVGPARLRPAAIHPADSRRRRSRPCLPDRPRHRDPPGHGPPRRQRVQRIRHVDHRLPARLRPHLRGHPLGRRPRDHPSRLRRDVR